MEPVPPDRSLDTRVRRKGARLVLVAAIVVAAILAVWVGRHLFIG